MYQKINQKIWVAGYYKDSVFRPIRFRWQNREIEINKITLVSNFKDGSIKKRFYSVLAGLELYRLEFNRENEAWYLRELWVD